MNWLGLIYFCACDDGEVVLFFFHFENFNGC